VHHYYNINKNEFLILKILKKMSSETILTVYGSKRDITEIGYNEFQKFLDGGTYKIKCVPDMYLYLKLLGLRPQICKTKIVESVEETDVLFCFMAKEYMTLYSATCAAIRHGKIINKKVVRVTPGGTLKVYEKDNKRYKKRTEYQCYNG
jgi:hypothetical protein